MTDVQTGSAGRFTVATPKAIHGQAQSLGTGKNQPAKLRESIVDDTSITVWIGRMKDGECAAAQKLWETYFATMVSLARGRLRDVPRRAADEEDVALSAFKSFCMGAKEGRFPQLTDRHDLWSLLVAITAHKATDMVRREQRQKRGSGRVRDEGALSPEQAFNFVISKEPTPEFATQIAEQCDQLLERLDDPILREVAVSKMHGYTVHEIANKLDCAERTVKRKLQRIRRLWTDSETAEEC